MFILYLLVFITGLGGTIAMSYGIGKYRPDPQGVGLLILTVLFLTFGVGGMISELADTYGETQYKQGQVDALTGNVKYELQTQKDSTTVWVEKDDQ